MSLKTKESEAHSFQILLGRKCPLTEASVSEVRALRSWCNTHQAGSARALSSHIRFSLHVLGAARILTAMVLWLLNSLGSLHCPWAVGVYRKSYPENDHLRNDELQAPFLKPHLRTLTGVENVFPAVGTAALSSV